MSDSLSESDLRQMVANRDYLIAEYQKQIEMLRDPVAVHLNMLRGGIAKPSWANIKHLYPEQFKYPDGNLERDQALTNVSNSSGIRQMNEGEA
jgi:hypothetical protein